jgi:hypothetical protein
LSLFSSFGGNINEEFTIYVKPRISKIIKSKIRIKKRKIKKKVERINKI